MNNKDISNDLEKETKKWLERIEKERKDIILLDNCRKDLLKNIDAYISDTKHFLKKGDLIRAFEAIVWAWSWLEILEELKVLKREK
jgi:hypothetical protein